MNVIGNSWVEFQDLVGASASRWPIVIRHLYWCSTLNYKERLAVTAFSYLNGASCEALLEVLRFTKVLTGQQSTRKAAEIVGLYNYWNDPSFGAHRRSKYYSYDLQLRTLTYLDGSYRGVRPGEFTYIARDTAQQRVEQLRRRHTAAGLHRVLGRQLPIESRLPTVRRLVATGVRLGEGC